MPIENCDYFIYVMQFHIPVPACCRLNSDGTYSVYLNSDYDFEHWLNGWEHEIMHIVRDDHYGEKNIMDIETQLR